MIDTKAADQLQDLIEKQKSLTSPHEQYVQGQVRQWEAMRESKRDILKSLIHWPADRDYIIDPLPSKISEAFADMLFGEDPVFLAAQTITDAESEAKKKAATGEGQTGNDTDSDVQSGDDSDDEVPESARIAPDETPTPDVEDQDKDDADDQSKLEAIVEANDLPSELRESEMVCSSEGEVWWRIYVDPSQSDYPVIEWHSRSHVRPLFRGRKLIAAAFVSEIYSESNSQTGESLAYRYVEIHSVGYVRNLLYKGTMAELGNEVPLTERQETAEISPEWSHGLSGMLCGRIPNRLGRDRRYGISDLHSVKDLVFSLNEATTVGHENMRLTAKKRAVVPLSALKGDGKFDASEDLLVIDDTDLDSEMGQEKSKAQFAVLEYSFDAQALIAYKSDVADIILTRVGISQQFVNTNSRNLGAAESGTALRVRLIPTTLAAKGKARFWDDALPKILMLAQLVDALPEQEGGFGRSWKYPGEPPSVEREQPLPQDETEEVTRHSTAVGAEIESRKTAIKELHPDWSDDQVQEELDQIDKELQEFGKPKPDQQQNANQQETLA